MIGCHSCVFSDLDCRIASPTPGRFGCSRETHQGRRHRAIVRALRCNASAIRLHRHVGPDRRCEPDRRSSSAQHPGREEGDQGRPHPRRLERQAREAPPEGSRRALDSQIHQGQAVRASRARLDRRHLSIWRFRCSAIRTTSRSIAVSASFAKGIFNLTDANGARRTPQPMRAAVCAMDFSTRRQDQHGAQRLGGHRLQIGRQRGVHAKEPLRQPCPS